MPKSSNRRLNDFKYWHINILVYSIKTVQKHYKIGDKKDLLAIVIQV